MQTYLIGYDLNKQGQDYTKLIEVIKKISTWWHCLDSTWIVKSNSSAKELRDYLRNYMDANDELLVVALTGEAAWHGFDQTCHDWLRQNINT